MIAWPGSLPSSPFRKATVTPVAGLNDAEAVINSVRTRTYPEQETIFSFFMSSVQLAAFKTFLDVTLNGSCASFSVPWLVGMGFPFYFLRINKAPTWQPVGQSWLVKMPVEVIAGAEADDGGDTAIWVSEEA